MKKRKTKYTETAEKPTSVTPDKPRTKVAAQDPPKAVSSEERGEEPAEAPSSPPPARKRRKTKEPEEGPIEVANAVSPPPKKRRRDSSKRKAYKLFKKLESQSSSLQKLFLPNPIKETVQPKPSNTPSPSPNLGRPSFHHICSRSETRETFFKKTKPRTKSASSEELVGEALYAVKDF